MNEFEKNKEPQHPIGVVSGRTGIPQDLLRAWEKRYRAVVPGRGPTGRRLYSDEDIEKLRLLRRAVAGGRRISDVASLSSEELRQLTKEDEAEISYAESIGRSVASTARNGHLEEALESLEDLDKDRFKRVLERAAVSLSSPNLRRQLLVPLLHTIGDRWRDGTLRVVHEHLASAIVRTFIEGLGDGTDKLPSAPRVVISTPSGQRHELGALLAAGAAEEHGWDVVYLGPDLPAEEIAAAVERFKPKAVALSIVYQNGDVQVQDELRRLTRYLSAEGTPIIVGGRAVGHLRSFFESLGVKCVEDLFEFQDELVALNR
jgi:methanogenic corrinoid protein MtbC1